jgi:hypothetical protein
MSAPSTFQLDTFIVVDDSTFVRQMDFLNGTLSFTFFNTSDQPYTVNAVVKNMFSVSNNDTAVIMREVSAGGSQTVDLNLADYYIKNNIPENRLLLRLFFDSPKLLK